ncbi:hypothetical protein CBR_g32328 [Chara braunii]|uniref:Uncharacterized protein n=1 Tax=Chara braunii TaxID=69332 RepID=A0A388JNC6_CHABU|nr:hypothetical protein CBR_g32328 [Chara braunii]|eukprot:GBG59316.1 hypothetical protein CBR_g32328 [Chara braunii]
MPGHDARDCEIYWKEKFEAKEGREGGESSRDGGQRHYRGRSASPPRRRWELAKRSPSADSRYRGRVERDSVRDLVDLITADREEKIARQKEEEEVAKREQDRLTKEEKRREKQEKKRREQQENDERLARLVNKHFASRWGEKTEEVEVESTPAYKKNPRRVRRGTRRAKHRQVPHPESATDDEVSDISRKTRRMCLSDRKRRPPTTEEEESFSSSQATPLQLHRRSRGRPPRTGRSAKKMKTGLQPMTMRKLREKKDTTRKGTAAAAGPGARQQFVDETIRHLDGLDYRQIQRMCKQAGVPYIRKP